jgi:hypothetical protein
MKRFAFLYVTGFLMSKSYISIPLESCAFELATRFEMGDRPFSVEAEVKKCVEERRY